MIVLYGGTFDPLHIGHMIVANEVYEAYSPDRFIFMPAAHSPLKTRHAVATDEERLQMLYLGVKTLGFGEVSAYELDKKGDSYTYDTVKHLLSQDDEVYVIIGTDQYHQLDNWYRIDELREMCRFVVVNREVEYNQGDSDVINFHIPRIDVSSTTIRMRLAEGQTVKFWLDSDIEAFVRKERIYEKEKSEQNS
ncbi:nicotinate (nicotinamide) nucleotide adenylyltransferase [Macrococcus hajekii]|uniref:Probable nicotinate-nucleotide adenylyltransferase n=1 Tax=Macrococcus hajekii TaxID=198482 RepID=A0A4R6BMH0_9STAP|nr:nicotinate-nucleotide adenylyltransferase [Macrococcus hajekii]TDM02857.1 nicotinate (nicotinamide) nucleotide adenylyltransferase [Macrococcus hajekii]GGB04439.1 putative nicotinate-nucleotide adenylyltransferase [Macrococcus hajekii]